MKKSLTFLQNPVIAVLLGILLTFAFAPYGLFPLAVLALAGLLGLWLQASSSPIKAFSLGYCFGLGLFGAGVYWVFTSIHVFGGVSAPFAVVITIGMIAFLSLYPAMVGYLLTRYFPHHQTAKLLYAFPAIWVISEWLRGHLFTGFPWLFLGYSQTNSPLKGYAPLLSVYAVSLAIVLSSALLVKAILDYRKKSLRDTLFSLLVLLAIWVFGGLLSLIPWTKNQGEPISVALVQGNIPLDIKWSPEHLQTSIDRYKDLTYPLWGKYNIIIWPESAIPIPLQDTENLINELDEKAKSSNSSLIMGIPIRTSDQTGFYNSLITLGKNQAVYSKRQLVPFGEYTPFSRFFSSAFQFFNIPIFEMISGHPLQDPFVIGETKTKILPSICYEIAFPELTRSTDKSINMLLVVTNDAWFGDSNAEPQHIQMAAMRAIEFQKPLLFVSNDGITAIIDAGGRVQSSLPQKQTAVLTGNIQPMYGITPWLYNGMDPIFFILFCMMFISIRVNKRPVNKNTTILENE